MDSYAGLDADAELRRGKWTPEEEQYAAAIIHYFLAGVLPIQYGTTLRGYIAQLLHCDPMRVSKKLVPGTVFVGIRIDPKIGRRSYYPCPPDVPGVEEHKQQAKCHLAQLRALFIESVEREEQQERTAKETPMRVMDVRLLSPLSREKFDSAKDTEDAEDDGGRRRPSLPSLNELIRQNRLREPSVSPVYQFSHDQHQSASEAASPRWPPSASPSAP